MLLILAGLPWFSSGVYLVGALLASVLPARCWPLLIASTRTALGAAITYGVFALFLGDKSMCGGGAAPIVCLLIAFLGWVIGAYSRRYLTGEVGQSRFALSFLTTLAAVSAVVVTTHLGVLIGAWAVSSAGLHHLLTFYRERPAATIVAHKKFLASRLAEAFLVIAAILLYREWGTLDMFAIATHVAQEISLPRAAGAAAVLISAAVLLKCAQLPLHGWLIQVMEAPTPVSALLHAGVVNLGGYVLIRLAPLIGASLTAQVLLVVVGSLTAAIAGLVMLTRVTIKVRLAWSTCSQMGFMVMECGLGLYDLALLHLIAHALYKAHAFLTAGEAVSEALARQLVAQSATDSSRLVILRSLLALVTAWIVAAGSAVWWHKVFGVLMVPWIATTLLACGLATLLCSPIQGRKPNWRGLLAVVAGTQLYLGWHWVLAERVGVTTRPPDPMLAAWVLMVFIVLYPVQSLVSINRRSSSTSAFYNWIYAGLYLDERFTRLTFRLWPARATAASEADSDALISTKPGSTA